MNGARRERTAGFWGGWLRWAALALFIAFAQPAWALRCISDGGGTSLTEPIGNVAAYPTDAPDGYVIWVSPIRTTTGYCYKDLGGGMQGFPENIYFYANPVNQNPAAWGLEVGIRYNGQDHFGAGHVPGSGIQVNNVVVPTCDKTDDDVKRGLCPKTPINISYQIVIRKKGPWRAPPSDIYAAFQFDGEKGLNLHNPSFRYHLSGMRNLKPTPCMVDVAVTPEPGIVRFGQIQEKDNGFSPAVPRKSFTLSLSKKCTVPVRVDGYFETSGEVRNGLLLPSSTSNFGIGLEDKQGNAIAFNQQFTLAQIPGNVATTSVELDAVLKAFGPPKTGPFNATATIRLFLY